MRRIGDTGFIQNIDWQLLRSHRVYPIRVTSERVELSDAQLLSSRTVFQSIDNGITNTPGGADDGDPQWIVKNMMFFRHIKIDRTLLCGR